MESHKKDNEAECLRRVIKNGTKKKGVTKRIIKHLICEDICRDEEERPDFVKYRVPESKHQRGTIIGIEHFRVDHLSLKKADDKIAATGIIHNKDVKSTYEKWHEKVQSSTEIPEVLIGELGQLFAKQLGRIQQTSYNIFLEAFRYSLENHLKNVKVYKENLSENAGKSVNIELAFLIEIHTEFLNLLLTDRKGTKKNKSGYMPMFEDIVNLLETIDKKDVDYVILCIGGTIHNDNVNVIAFRTGDIRKQLANQSIEIYEYVGEDKYLQEFKTIHKDVEIKPVYTVDSDRAIFSFQYSSRELTDEQRCEIYMLAFKRALELQKKGVNYATTLIVQGLIDVWGEYVIGWPPISGKTDVRPWMKHYAQNDIDKKYKEFEREWFNLL